MRLGSRWVRLEFLEAIRREKLVVPLQIDACELPLEMLDLNAVVVNSDLDGAVATGVSGAARR